MKEDFSGFNAEFLFAKLHAIIARSLTGQRLSVISSCNSIEDLEHVLKPMGISFENPLTVQDQIYHSLFAQVQPVMNNLPEGLQHYYLLLFGRFFCDGVKALLRRSYQAETQEGDDNVFAVPGYVSIYLNAQQGIVFGHHGYLPEGWKETIQSFFKADRTLSQFCAENKLDMMYWQTLLDYCRQMPSCFTRHMMSYFGQVIDFVNMLIIMRSRAYYHLEDEVLEDILFPGGLLMNKASLLELAHIEPERVREVLPAEYAVLLPPPGGTIAELERSFNRHLSKEQWKRFSDFNNPIDSVMVFPLLKIFEMQNIARCYEGLRLGLSKELIHRFLLGN